MYMCVHVLGVAGEVVGRFTLISCRREYRNFVAFYTRQSCRAGGPGARVAILLYCEALLAWDVLYNVASVRR